LFSGQVAAVFRKSLHLSFRGRQSFSAGRITNMMTSDAEALQVRCLKLGRSHLDVQRLVKFVSYKTSPLG
jgi:hypothetical protein